MYDTPEEEDEDDVRLLALHSRRPQSRVRAAAVSGVLVVLVVSLLFYSATVIQRSSTVEHPSSALTRAKAANSPLLVASQSDENALSTAGDGSCQDESPVECGDSVATAMERNCPFDVMSNLWTPSHCHDDEFALESLHGVEVFSDGGGVGAPEFGLKEFLWFEDAEATRTISSTHDLEQFLLQRDQSGLPLEAYTSMPFHAAHCSYLARVATRGLNKVNAGESHIWIPEVATNPSHARHCEHVFGELYRMNETEARRQWTMVGFGFSPCVRIG